VRKLNGYHIYLFIFGLLHQTGTEYR
jgi:hypothetical protein